MSNNSLFPSAKYFQRNMKIIEKSETQRRNKIYDLESKITNINFVNILLTNADLYGNYIINEYKAFIIKQLEYDPLIKFLFRKKQIKRRLKFFNDLLYYISEYIEDRLDLVNFSQAFSRSGRNMFPYFDHHKIFGLRTHLCIYGYYTLIGLSKLPKRNKTIWGSEVLFSFFPEVYNSGKKSLTIGNMQIKKGKKYDKYGIFLFMYNNFGEDFVRMKNWGCLFNNLMEEERYNRIGIDVEYSRILHFMILDEHLSKVAI